MSEPEGEAAKQQHCFKNLTHLSHHPVTGSTFRKIRFSVERHIDTMLTSDRLVSPIDTSVGDALLPQPNQTATVSQH